MKLLFDENLSPHLVEALSGEFPGSTHVRDVGLQLRPPPKVVWVKVGNADTGTIESLLRSRRIQIEEFDSEEGAAFLILR